MPSLLEHATALDSGATSARALVEDCLAAIGDPAGEGRAAFRAVYHNAVQVAEAMDTLRRHGRAPGPLAGIPFSLKDLFDVAGEPTPAGSRLLAEAPPARAHAPLIQRMLAAGMVAVGRTNMTEFAYSGLGINPHYGTPRSPWDRATGRIAGGSSSGAAVSVADGMAPVALGTDTGGSCRIPAAFCGVVGYKPTARRVPLAGVLPLAPSLDSVGPLARSVACCAVVDAVLAGAAPGAEAPAAYGASSRASFGVSPGAALAVPSPAEIVGLRLWAPENYVLEGMDPIVGAAYEAALRRLAAAGARIVRGRFAALDEIPRINASGGLASTEAYAWHRELLARGAALYDPRVRVRIERGRLQSGADYALLCQARAALIGRAAAATAAHDAVVMPTVPIVPPPLAAFADDATYGEINNLVLRNPTVGNFLDRCAISLPCHRPGEAPVGLMLMGETMGDARLFAVAAAVEAALRP
jgi:aspartyl-tRNA(Asn)/glutamyl-tRNA(Gln) amidotransferase subunit A